MSSAIECDRCGKLEVAWDVEDADLLLSRYIERGFGGGVPDRKRFDLCRACHESLQRWWHRPEVG